MPTSGAFEITDDDSYYGEDDSYLNIRDENLRTKIPTVWSDEVILKIFICFYFSFNLLWEPKRLTKGLKMPEEKFLADTVKYVLMLQLIAQKCFVERCLKLWFLSRVLSRILLIKCFSNYF